MPFDLEAIRARWRGLVDGVNFAWSFMSSETTTKLAVDFRALITEIERLTMPHEREIALRCWPKPDASLPVPLRAFDFIIDQACLRAGWAYVWDLSPRWIPVAEWLPKAEPGLVMIVACDNEFVGEATWQPSGWEWPNATACQPVAPVKLTVTHVTPLPEPPK